jgi:hypothetical protein
MKTTTEELDEHKLSELETGAVIATSLVVDVRPRSTSDEREVLIACNPATGRRSVWYLEAA